MEGGAHPTNAEGTKIMKTKEIIEEREKKTIGGSGNKTIKERDKEKEKVEEGANKIKTVEEGTIILANVL